MKCCGIADLGICPFRCCGIKQNEYVQQPPGVLRQLTVAGVLQELLVGHMPSGMSFEQFKRMCSDKEFCEDIEDTKLQLRAILKAVELHLWGIYRSPDT